MVNQSTFEDTMTAEEEEVLRGMMEGRKFDSGKADYTLVPWDALEQIVKVLEFGAKKYARENWRHVPDARRRYLAASVRHLAAYMNGEAKDTETGLSHIAHAGCCVLFLLSLDLQDTKD